MDSQEKALESAFVKWCDSIGGKAVKGPSFMYKGIPDRIAYLPSGGGTVWIEFKGGTYYSLTPMQKEWRDVLIDSNPNRYFVVDTKEDLAYLKKVCEQFIKNGADIVKYEKDLTQIDEYDII